MAKVVHIKTHRVAASIRVTINHAPHATNDLHHVVTNTIVLKSAHLARHKLIAAHARNSTIVHSAASSHQAVNVRNALSMLALVNGAIVARDKTVKNDAHATTAPLSINRTIAVSVLHRLNLHNAHNVQNMVSAPNAHRVLNVHHVLNAHPVQSVHNAAILPHAGNALIVTASANGKAVAALARNVRLMVIVRNVANVIQMRVSHAANMRHAQTSRAATSHV